MASLFAYAYTKVCCGVFFFHAVSSLCRRFAVETIGDCYMACCGCPKPAQDHAERCADFALAVQLACQRVLEEEVLPPAPLLCMLTLIIRGYRR